ncbi:hypothetical protein KY347_00615 [Candidatus Woesearchaeota archaeon]|nr:hypothetical protein [Candidatus Woesearchaeota archaeon]
MAKGRHSGIVVSDCHYEVVQTKICGIYVDKTTIDCQGMSGLMKAIEEGNFVRYGSPENGPYVSRGSWLRGMGLTTFL